MSSEDLFRHQFCTRPLHHDINRELQYFHINNAKKQQPYTFVKDYTNLTDVEKDMFRRVCVLTDGDVEKAIIRIFGPWYTYQTNDISNQL